ncbi:hypothetical protein CEUSTIGMA_g7664.t1 [Chlamydomonas eustigma]|uniref:Uncharacterized protein n=1 Tax=Chlamydomonas eustigma TaxID=1157962 RepID=A0A250XAZ4_9CHLO|nr:hypothetical protein CEUSTIGMA_g7664.t1 [Chlamydomonas eustigma]|eukprot:GAX80226.1 hypothetical protein CEUSTIGMA_g7664.t1 [Chlamydomonas eustigma]
MSGRAFYSQQLPPFDANSMQQRYINQMQGVQMNTVQIDNSDDNYLRLPQLQGRPTAPSAASFDNSNMQQNSPPPPKMYQVSQPATAYSQQTAVNSRQQPAALLNNNLPQPAASAAQHMMSTALQPLQHQPQHGSIVQSLPSSQQPTGGLPGPPQQQSDATPFLQSQPQQKPADHVGSAAGVMMAHGGVSWDQQAASQQQSYQGQVPTAFQQGLHQGQQPISFSMHLPYLQQALGPMPSNNQQPYLQQALGPMPSNNHLLPPLNQAQLELKSVPQNGYMGGLTMPAAAAIAHGPYSVEVGQVGGMIPSAAPANYYPHQSGPAGGVIGHLYPSGLGVMPPPPHVVLPPEQQLQQYMPESYPLVAGPAVIPGYPGVNHNAQRLRFDGTVISEEVSEGLQHDDLITQQEQRHATYGPYYTKPIPPSILGVTINRSDVFKVHTIDHDDLLGLLQHDHLLSNPVVRVHVLDPNTGSYMRNLAEPGTVMDPAAQSHMLEFAGRPHMLTLNNDSSQPSPAVQEYIPPIQTMPFDLLVRPDIKNSGRWEEMLQIDEAIERLVALDALILFEVLQPVITYRRYEKHKKEYDGGVHRIAWGFLKVAGPGGKPLLGRLQLQLYKYRCTSGVLGFNIKPPPGYGPQTPFYAFSTWQALMTERSATNILYKAAGPSVSKYPGTLTVTIDAVERPPPSVTVTDPFQGIRPKLPAGYGSGFETGSQPLEAILPTGDLVGPGGLATVQGLPGWQVPTQEELTRHENYRALGEQCEAPNSVVQKFSTSACGASALCFSHSGTYLAAACGDPNNVFRIIFWNILTGSAMTKLHHAHNDFVYDLQWSDKDDAMLSSSSDGTAKIWELNHYSRVTKSIKPKALRHATYVYAALVSLEAHATYVYAALFHPSQRTHPFIVTGCHDGALRVWSRSSGIMLVAVRDDGLSGRINSVSFDLQGTRLYAADNHGGLVEFSFDGSAAHASLKEETEMPQEVSQVKNEPSLDAPSNVMNLNIKEDGLQRGDVQPAAGGGEQLPEEQQQQQQQKPLAGSDGLPIHHKPLPPSESILRRQRTCEEFRGLFITHLFLSPNGHRLGVLTKRNVLAAVDTKTLLTVAEYDGGVRCKSSPIRPTFTPDGNYVVSGSEDGRCFLWSVDGGASPIHLPRFTLGGETVLCIAWNNIFNVAAICGYASWAPVALLAYDKSKPRMLLPARHTPDPLDGDNSKKKSKAVHRPSHKKWELPDRLTPEMVKRMLTDLRSDALKRNIIKGPQDPLGDKLAVKSSALLTAFPPAAVAEEIHSVEQELKDRQQQQQQQSLGVKEPREPDMDNRNDAARRASTEAQVPWRRDEIRVASPDDEGLGGEGSPVVRYNSFGPDSEFSDTRQDSSRQQGSMLNHSTTAAAHTAGSSSQSLKEQPLSRAAEQQLHGGGERRQVPPQEIQSSKPLDRYNPTNLDAVQHDPHLLESSSTSQIEKMILEPRSAASNSSGIIPLPPPGPVQQPVPGSSSTASHPDHTGNAVDRGTDGKHGLAGEEVERLARAGGAMVVAGPGSTVVAGAGSTVVMTAGAQVIDVGARQAQEQRQAAQVAASTVVGGDPYKLNLEGPLVKQAVVVEGA